jgi:aspartate-semialdehyde dehydrogenase
MSGGGLNVAIAGATGAVGEEFISILEERNFPVANMRFLASERSEGKKLEFRGESITVEVLREDSFQGIDLALFSAGGARSKQFAPAAVESGAVVVDNSSAFRMEPDVPLVVPEVNPHAISEHNGIIANPNCSTIQMVVALKPLHDHSRIRRVIVSTYQSVSGTGKKAIHELETQTRSLMSLQDIECSVYPHQIAFNCLPHIDRFEDNGFTFEEIKMINETRKIMEDDDMAVTATTVRVPVFYAHSESIYIETEERITADLARELLQDAPGVEVVDDPSKNDYPLAVRAAGKDEVFVGRIREDLFTHNALNIWVVSDNIRKGAALNAVQIAEELFNTK